MTTDLLDTLSLARAYLDAGWCKGHTAEDSEGRQVPSDRPEAVAWCLIGSIDAAYHEQLFDLPYGFRLRNLLVDRITRVAWETYRDTAQDVNDSLGKDAACYLLDVVSAEIGKG